MQSEIIQTERTFDLLLKTSNSLFLELPLYASTVSSSELWDVWSCIVWCNVSFCIKKKEIQGWLRINCPLLEKNIILGSNWNGFFFNWVNFFFVLNITCLLPHYLISRLHNSKRNWRVVGFLWEHSSTLGFGPWTSLWARYW